MRHNPRVLNLQFKDGLKRAEINNLVDLYVSGEMVTL